MPERSFRHWSPRYVWDRVQLFRHERAHPDDPWLTGEAVRFLDNWLRPGDAGVEWGTGRSTAWFARRVGRLLSIEHDERWYSRVSAQLTARRIATVDLRLAPVEEAERPTRDHPYLALATSVPAHSLDFVLVDGVWREHCAEVALGLVRPGGLLVLDNANWFLPHATRSPASVGAQGVPHNECWTGVWRRLKPLRCLWTSNGVTDTAIFFAE
jgi:predicted O-methyltransferase YrrM